MFNIFKEVIIRVRRYLFEYRKLNKLNTVRYVYRRNVPTRILDSDLDIRVGTTFRYITSVLRVNTYNIFLLENLKLLYRLSTMEWIIVIILKYLQ